MVATHNGKQPGRFRELPLLNVFDPRPINTNGNIVLGLTSNGTSMAPNAFAVINDKAKISQCSGRRSHQFPWKLQKLTITPTISKFDKLPQETTPKIIRI